MSVYLGYWLVTGLFLVAGAAFYFWPDDPDVRGIDNMGKTISGLTLLAIGIVLTAIGWLIW